MCRAAARVIIWAGRLAACVEKPVMSVRIGVMKVNAAKLAPKPRMVMLIIARISGCTSVASCVLARPAACAGT